jgi:hypothetical protein
MNIPPGKIHKNKSRRRGNNTDGINNRPYPNVKKDTDFWPYTNSGIQTLRGPKILLGKNFAFNTTTLAMYNSMFHTSPLNILKITRNFPT